jgi:hypothetical protein
MLLIIVLQNNRKNGKNEYVTKYVVEHVPQQNALNRIGFEDKRIPRNIIASSTKHAP